MVNNNYSNINDKIYIFIDKNDMSNYEKLLIRFNRITECNNINIIFVNNSPHPRFYSH